MKRSIEAKRFGSIKGSRRQKERGGGGGGGGGAAADDFVHTLLLETGRDYTDGTGKVYGKYGECEAPLEASGTELNRKAVVIVAVYSCRVRMRLRVRHSTDCHIF
jgi:hypothetical protein